MPKGAAFEPSHSKLSAQRILEGLLWVFGVFGLLAIAPTLMPRSWLAAAVQQAQPDSPFGLLVEYLARALSAMCFLLGGLLCIAATDVCRYAPMIRWMASFLLVAGLSQCILLGWLAYPKSLVWLLLSTDGAIVALFGLTVLVLLRKVVSFYRSE